MSISDKLQTILNDNADISSAIAAKGVTVPSGAGTSDFAGLIAQIVQGGCLPDGMKIAVAENTARASKSVTTSTASGSATLNNSTEITIDSPDIVVYGCYYAYGVKQQQSTSSPSSTTWYNTTALSIPIVDSVGLESVQYSKTHPTETSTKLQCIKSIQYSWTKPASGTQYKLVKYTLITIFLYKECE